MSERSGDELAAAITRRASLQSYLTIRWLADRTYRPDAFALYAWFRWLDDAVDEHLATPDARVRFVAQQRDLLARAVAQASASAASPTGDLRAGLAPEETLLVDLLRRDASRPGRGPDGPSECLVLALRSMLDVMDVDARRRGRTITADQLDAYTHDLAVAVTESLHHCIGHDCRSPHDETRYVAVTGAHVAHMLRDLAEDLVAGYLNLPAELLADGVPHATTPDDPALLAALHTPAVRDWVHERVELARECFATGRGYLARVDNARCRFAGHAYTARFEWVLDVIEADGYRLRPGYPERATLRGGLSIAGRTARSALGAVVHPSPAASSPARSGTR
ncbi:squalene/phytoene synthase family protein [Actinotalea sp. M2MS4P-6]|uniref:squalene/phytoene synthase family protein n=1 Tax=Actinotalea sp. M2MS4P-6 TaxID=2983762 RepID=UPI0021E4EB9A|nr:squalene/phytoene synthase family protein [Actinotalea sp. M2MS4P-6]MCV2393658.1 squalene/phytoene synthase family protein [Actinotalea sp. M2MS4P-6]